MNIREQLIAKHSRKNALEIAEYACQAQEHFDELMENFLSPIYRIAQRAAGSVNFAAATKTPFLVPFVPKLVAQLERTDVHDAVIRNTLRILEDYDIPPELEGVVMNACFQYIEDFNSAPAIKAYSLTILFRLSNTYPEIKSELKLIINDHSDRETPAFLARARKILPYL